MNKVYVISRLQHDGYEGSQAVDTYAGKTLDEAKQAAVNDCMVDWFQERVDSNEEDDTDDINLIYEAYVDYWSAEEDWNIEEHSL